VVAADLINSRRPQGGILQQGQKGAWWGGGNMNHVVAVQLIAADRRTRDVLTVHTMLNSHSMQLA
jgi:hypothetical protein